MIFVTNRLPYGHGERLCGALDTRSKALWTTVCQTYVHVFIFIPALLPVFYVEHRSNRSDMLNDK